MEHMARTVTAAKKQKPSSLLAYGSLCLLWAGATGLSVVTTTGVTAARIRLSAAQVRIVDIVFAAPLLLIWLAVLFAALSMWRYSRMIAGAKESAGFRYLSYGIFVLLTGLIAGSYLGGLQQLVSRHASDPQAVKTAYVVINNYVSVVSALAMYALLLHGSQLLLKTLGKHISVGKKLIPIVAGFVALTAAYLWLIHSNPASRVSLSPGTNPTFGLPYWLIVLTVALPLVVSWVLGVAALIGLYQYGRRTPGIVYQILFKKLVVGMTLLIGLTIALQLFTQLYTLYADSTLSFLLGIIVVIYLLLTYAFLLIAQGAAKLNAIETLVS